MHLANSAPIRPCFIFAVCLFMAMTVGSLHGQKPPAPAADSHVAPEPLNWTTQQDHKNMMEQLGITRLRPVPNGNANATNAAN